MIITHGQIRTCLQAHSIYHAFLHNQSDSLSVNSYDDCLISKNESLGIFNNDSFPNVKCIFMKFNTPEASSACSERLFSGGKLIFETKCNRLGDKNFENYYYILNSNKNL